MIITIGGPAGSGTSTVAKILSKKLNYRHIDAGQIWDELAREHNTDVLGLSKIAENDKSIDYELDNKMLNYAKYKDNIILEGRLIGSLCSKNNINSLKIWIEASIDTRTKRVCRREGDDFQKTKNDIILREKSNKKRYLEYYNIDIDDKSYYDLVVNSENKSPDVISELILNRANKFKQENG